MQSTFKELEGGYGEVKLLHEDDQFYWVDQRALLFRLLPMAENQFIIPGKYALQIVIVKEEGEVTGVNLMYRDGRVEFHPRTSQWAINYASN